LASDQEETKLGSYLFDLGKRGSKKGSYLFSSDKEQTVLGKHRKQKGKVQIEKGSLRIFVRENANQNREGVCE